MFTLVDLVVKVYQEFYFNSEKDVKLTFFLPAKFYLHDNVLKNSTVI